MAATTKMPTKREPMPRPGMGRAAAPPPDRGKAGAERRDRPAPPRRVAWAPWGRGGAGVSPFPAALRGGGLGPWGRGGCRRFPFAAALLPELAVGLGQLLAVQAEVIGIGPDKALGIGCGGQDGVIAGFDGPQIPDADLRNLLDV